MISINKQGNAIVIEFTDNDKYLFNGKIEVAPNELIVVVDDSEMATFKKASNGDVLFSQLISDIQIAGSPVTKDTIIDQFATIGFISGSGEGAVSSVNGQTGDVVITPASLNVYNKTEVESALEEKQEVFQVNSPMAFSRDTTTQDLHLSVDLSGYATKKELADKQDAGDYATKTELQNVSAEVEHKADKTSVYTMQEVNNKLATKQAILNPGDNITLSTPDAEGKVTISATQPDISGLATIKSVEEISGEVATLSTDKQDKLVSGQNIKTINGDSILGEGNIEITGGTSNKTWNFTGATEFLTGASVNAGLSVLGGTVSYGEVSVGDIVVLDTNYNFVVLNKFTDAYGKHITIMPIYNAITNDSTVLGYVIDLQEHATSDASIKKATLTSKVYNATAAEDIRKDTTAGIALSGFSGFTTAKPGDIVHITYSNKYYDLVVTGKYYNGVAIFLALSGLGDKHVGYTIDSRNYLHGYIPSGGGGTVDTEMSDTSENAVQNKVIKSYVDGLVPVTFTTTADKDITGDTSQLGAIQLYKSNGFDGFDGFDDAKPGDIVTIKYEKFHLDLVVTGRSQGAYGTSALFLNGLGNALTGFKINRSGQMTSYIPFDAKADKSVAIGNGAYASLKDNTSVAVGYYASADGPGSVAVGSSSGAANYSTAIGKGAKANGQGTTIIGANLKAYEYGEHFQELYNNLVAIGYYDVDEDTGVEVFTHSAKGITSIREGGVLKQVAVKDDVPTTEEKTSWNNTATKVATMPNFVTLTQTEYEALETKDANTVYLIKEA